MRLGSLLPCIVNTHGPLAAHRLRAVCVTCLFTCCMHLSMWNCGPVRLPMQAVV